MNTHYDHDEFTRLVQEGLKRAHIERSQAFRAGFAYIGQKLSNLVKAASSKPEANFHDHSTAS